MDGAMGTELQRLTGNPAVSAAQCNLSEPGLVRAVHRAYVDAGAEVLLTNTFQAMADHAIWEAALRIAREAAGDQAFVLADVGPVSGLTEEIASRIVTEAMGADGLLLETWSDAGELEVFARMAARHLPLLVSFTFLPSDNRLTTITGLTPEECARAAHACGAVALGANCGKDISIADMAKLAQRFRSACDLPIMVKANAGTPTLTESGWVYPEAPETMAAGLSAVLEAGAVMIGGCCGTTPAHIRAIGEVIRVRNRLSPRPPGEEFGVRGTS